ncbi:hypothetical protein FFL01_05060 [Flavobacterium flevense]|uniref:Uncharacterized protein n=1 Tax=Flavobacterium flevense TaxID=983 RepID=A0A4Y4AVN2_9FLAO|nr:hypothetical protein FFL01_05060 [Flavobacterium flevense]
MLRTFTPDINYIKFLDDLNLKPYLKSKRQFNQNPINQFNHQNEKIPDSITGFSAVEHFIIQSKANGILRQRANCRKRKRTLLC